MPNLEMPFPKQFLKVAEVAELLKVKPRTIYEMVGAESHSLSQAAWVKHSAF